MEALNVWYTGVMDSTHTLTVSPKVCGCGCDEAVTRSFKPGHDAKLKSALVAATKSSAWWVREAAIKALAGRNWLQFAAAEDISRNPIRNRFHGRFVTTRHIEALETVQLDAADIGHSTDGCPAIVGRVAYAEGGAGWACSTCIHTSDWTQIAARSAANTWALKGNPFDPWK